MKKVVDLNSDLGEGAGHDDEILDLVTSANIACGFHAGSPGSILSSIRRAKEKHVAVGAHPSLQDRENFGRTEMRIAPEEVFALVCYQLGAFAALCGAAGVELKHVKPHGALYNMAASDRALADAIAHAVLAIDSQLTLFVPAASELSRAAEALQIHTAAEVFADRNYNADGSLVSRTRPNAILRDPVAAADRVLRMLREEKVQSVKGTDVPITVETICVHGDTPGAVTFVRELRRQLEREGIRIAAPGQ